MIGFPGLAAFRSQAWKGCSLTLQGPGVSGFLPTVSCTVSCLQGAPIQAKGQKVVHLPRDLGTGMTS